MYAVYNDSGNGPGSGKMLATIPHVRVQFLLALQFLLYFLTLC